MASGFQKLLSDILKKNWNELHVCAGHDTLKDPHVKKVKTSSKVKVKKQGSDKYKPQGQGLIHGVIR